MKSKNPFVSSSNPGSSWWYQPLGQEERAGTDVHGVPPGHEEELLKILPPSVNILKLKVWKLGWRRPPRSASPAFEDRKSVV